MVWILAATRAHVTGKGSEVHSVGSAKTGGLRWAMLLVPVVFAGVLLGFVIVHKTGLSHRPGFVESGEQPWDNPTLLQLGQTFPMPEVIDTSGAVISLGGYVDGRKALVVFVADGCPPCHTLLRSIRTNRVMPDSSYCLVLLALDPGPLRREYSHPVFAVRWEYMVEHGIANYPTVCGIDACGQLRFVMPGLSERLDREFVVSYL